MVNRMYEQGDGSSSSAIRTIASVVKTQLFLIAFLLFSQSGLDATGLQRAGDWQEDGGEETEEPRGEEEGTGGEAGHGIWQQEVKTRRKPRLNLCHVNYITPLERDITVCGRLIAQNAERCVSGCLFWEFYCTFRLKRLIRCDFDLPQCRVSFRDGWDAGDRAGDPGGSQILFSL